jgi:hypothetical protein
MLGAPIPAITEIRTPMMAHQDTEYLTAHAVRDRAIRVSRRLGLGSLGRPDPMSSVAGAHRYRVCACAVRQPPLSDFVLDLPPDVAGVSGRASNAISENRCATATTPCGETVIDSTLACDRGYLWDRAAGLNRFLELHRMRAGPQSTPSIHPDRFTSQVSRDFLYAVCNRLARQGNVPGCLP